MAHPQEAKHFRFLDLPAELRNKVYEFALISPEQVMLPSACKHKQRYEAVQPALTRTNRQIRRECLPMFYVENTFKYHVHGCDLGYFINYMDSIGVDNRKNIRNVMLVVKDRLTCGKGLHDFVRWCAQTDGTDEMMIDTTARDWHLEFATTMFDDEYAEVEKDLDDSCRFLGDTMEAISEAIDVARQLWENGTTRSMHVRRAWEVRLDDIAFECIACRRGHLDRRAMERNVYTGHCGDMCRFMDFGTGCNETVDDEEEESDII